jgi:RND family efflux transporter MFP subunit
MPRVLTPLRLALLAGVVLFFVLPLWWSRTPPPRVEIAQVVRGPLQVKVATNGKIEPLDEAEVEVRARLDGRMLEIPDPGTHIDEGDVVLRIDDSPVASDLAKAESDRLAALEALRSAKHELSVLSEHFATDKELYAQGALTREKFTESEAALKDAGARVESLEREVPLRVQALELRIEELKSKLGSAVVHAPFDGTVYRTEAKKGEVVKEGDPILWIADLTRLRVRANVDQVDLGRVKKGQRVIIGSNAFPGRTWTGYVTEVVPHVVVKESRSISEGLARLDPPTYGLVPGMTVDVDIIVAEAADVLQVPAESVFSNGGGRSFVFRIDGRRVRQTPVQVGLASVSSVEIRDGLEEGAAVVLGPIRGLADGMKVQVAKGESDSNR